MCGRFYFRLEGESPELQKLRLRTKQLEIFDFTQGEVFPTQKVLVLVKGDHKAQPTVKTWGFHNYQNNIVINARMEGIEQKKMFCPYVKNRCVIPCNGFYEWLKHGKQKDKILIAKKNQPLQYMAGFYNQLDEFVIVTGEASGAMASIHDRTPILLTKEQILPYLNNELPYQVDNENLVFQKEEQK